MLYLPVLSYIRAISIAGLMLAGSLYDVATMGGVLDLTDSRARIAEAKDQYGELRGVFNGWMEGGTPGTVPHSSQRLLPFGPCGDGGRGRVAPPGVVAACGRLRALHLVLSATRASAIADQNP